MAGKTHAMHGRDHAGNGADPVLVKYHIKVLGDADPLVTGDGQIIVLIDDDIGSCDLVKVTAYVTTVSSSGAPTIQIRNVTEAADMLTTKVTIDAGEFSSFTAATPAVIDQANDDVTQGDLLSIDVDAAGTGAMGLGVILTFGRAIPIP